MNRRISVMQRKPMKGFEKPRHFIGLLILDVINRFMSGHEFHVYCMYFEETKEY